MANTFKLKTKANVGLTTTNVYEVPTGTTSTVLGIAIANTSGVSVLVGVGITRPTEDDVNLLKNVPIPQGSTLEFVEGNKRKGVMTIVGWQVTFYLFLSRGEGIYWRFNYLFYLIGLAIGAICIFKKLVSMLRAFVDAED